MAYIKYYFKPQVAKRKQLPLLWTEYKYKENPFNICTRTYPIKVTIMELWEQAKSCLFNQETTQHNTLLFTFAGCFLPYNLFD